MTGSDKLLKNTIVYAAGNLGSRVLAFLLVPLYSYYLSKEDLGYYDLITTSVMMLVPFLSIQISDAVYRWLIEARNDAEKAAAVTNGAAVLCFTIVPFALLFFVADVYLNIQYGYYFLSLLFLTIASVFFQQILRGLGNNKLYSFVGILYTFLLVGFNVVFLFYTNLLVEGLLLASIIAYVLMLAATVATGKFYPLFRISSISRSSIRKMIAYSGPLIPNTISWWLINEVNRFIILYFLGLEFNGIFAMANRFPSLILMVNSIFMLAWQDHAISSSGTQEKKTDATRIFHMFMVLELSLAIFLISITRYMIQFLVDAKFYASWQYIPLLYLAVVFSSFASFLGVGYLNAKKTKGIFYTTIVGSLVNIAVTFGSIRFIGLYAPAVGMASGFFCMWIVRIRQTKSFYHIDIHYSTFVTLLLVSIVFSFLIRIDNLFLSVAMIAAAILIFLYCNRLLLSTIYNKLKQQMILKKQP